MPDEPAKPVQRTEDEHYAEYANNTFLEASAWDLKIFFGQLEQHLGSAKVDWHTAITIPWMQAKILLFYIRVNIAVHEQQNGPMRVPTSVIPPKPAPLTPEQESQPGAKELHELVTRIHTAMFG